MNTTANTDWFALEDSIETMLRAALPSSITIERAGDLESSQGRSAKLPAVYLVNLGDDIAPPQSAGGVQRVTQRYSVVVVAANPTKQGAKAKGSAGPIISAIIGALQGAFPPADAPIKLTERIVRLPAAAPFYDGGRAYFDIRFGFTFQSPLEAGNA